LINSFNQKVLTWYKQFGRDNLPWRQIITPYRVWLSEIMLQQTQVTTVLPYFTRFMVRFPTIHELANAPLDEVLHLWSGLGYYSRARNLHRTAQTVVDEWNGEFPSSPTQLQLLPGIGRSTAGAIAAIAFNQQAAILDGNVKRVLARVFTVEGWPGETVVANQLWALSESLTPKKQVSNYTQAMMDLGALVCTRTKPKCSLCPVSNECLASQHQTTDQFPGPKPKKIKPIKAKQFLILQQHNSGAVLLLRRPERGIWGGLYSFPECDLNEDAITWCKIHLNLTPILQEPLVSFRHTFTHYHLDISPIRLILPKTHPANLKKVMEKHNGLWYKKNLKKPLGLPAPIHTLLQQIFDPINS